MPGLRAVYYENPVGKIHANWKQLFQEIKRGLTSLIAFADPEIKHTGSTSVEGLSVKFVK